MKITLTISGLNFTPGSDHVEWSGKLMGDGWDTQQAVFPKAIKEEITPEEKRCLEKIIRRIQGTKAAEPVPEVVAVPEEKGEELES